MSTGPKLGDGMRMIEQMTKRRVMAENAQREREIRSDLIEDVRDAIFADTDAWTSSNIERMAEIAVDAVADYYRRAAGTNP